NRYSIARISRGKGADATPLQLDATRTRLGVEQPAGTFYDRLKRRGLGYGAAFRGVTQLFARGREVLARIGPIDGLEAVDGSPHPALLDAAFQLLAAGSMSANEQDTRLFLPVAIAEVRQHALIGTRFWAHCQMQSKGASKVTGSIELYADDGAPLLTVRG